MITFTIPGEPKGWKRPGLKNVAGHTKIFDQSADEKATAQAHAVEQMAGADPLQGPVSVVITALFSCPLTQYRKRTPQPKRWKDNGFDADNLAKLYLDALTGIAYIDDRQVADLRVKKFTAAQGKAPSVKIEVEQIGGRRPR